MGQTSFDGLPAGDYSYTALDASGCEIVENFTINTPDSLFVNASQTLESCFGLSQSEAVALAGGGSGNYTYTWSNGNTGTNITNLPTGTLNVTVIDDAGCEATANLVITELAPISFNLIAEPPTCNGFSDGGVGVNQITGGIGTSETDYNILWQDGNTDMVRTNVPGGITYAVTITDQQGCTASQSRLMEDPAPVTFTLVAESASCYQFGDGTASIVNVSGPNGNSFTYNWDANAANQSTPIATNLSAGEYTVTVTDTENCVGVQSVVIGQPEPLVANVTVKDNECYSYSNGSITVQVEGGTPGYSFNWSNGSTSNSLTNLPATDYVVTITDIKGCEIITTATVAEPIALEAATIATPVSCFGDRDGSIEIVTNGGTPPFRFSLDNQNYTTNNMLIGLKGGNYNIFILDVNGCQFLTSATIDEPSQFMVDAGSDLTIIFGRNKN
ncbi:MAG: SprB repeat-containing protein [Saprospiraceae bacterium]